MPMQKGWLRREEIGSPTVSGGLWDSQGFKANEW
jgi:hypothetical protein